MKLYSRQCLPVLLLTSAMALAQPPQGPGAGSGAPPPAPAPPAPPAEQGRVPPPPRPMRPPMERALQPGPAGRWWNNSEMAQKLGLTADQQKQMDQIFQESRLKLIDLNAALQKEEVILQPMLEADPPDEAKILAQIDRVAQARAELEKGNARMLLGIRRVLTQDQWKKLRERTPRPQGERGGPRRSQQPPRPPQL